MFAENQVGPDLIAIQRVTLLILRRFHDVSVVMSKNFPDVWETIVRKSPKSTTTGASQPLTEMLRSFPPLSFYQRRWRHTPQVLPTWQSTGTRRCIAAAVASLTYSCDSFQILCLRHLFPFSPDIRSSSWTAGATWHQSPVWGSDFV